MALDLNCICKADFGYACVWHAEDRRHLGSDCLTLGRTNLLCEPSGKERIQVFGIKPHKTFEILALDIVGFILFLCEFRQVLGFNGITLKRSEMENGTTIRTGSDTASLSYAFAFRNYFLNFAY